MGNSLRLRLVAGGAVAIAVALAIAGLAFTILFERHVKRSLADDLEVHLNQLLASIDVDASNQIVLRQQPSDPRFAEPLSGLYWQIGDDGNQLLRSRSLWDTTISLPKDDPSPDEIHLHELSGPVNARILLIERLVRLAVGGRPAPVRVAVAVDLKRVTAAGSAFAADLIWALVLLGAVLAAATWIQVSLGLRSLDMLRGSVAAIRSARDLRLTSHVPTEVQPLVQEVNALLDAREQEIVRSRNRASDLAHGLKTPLAALGTDATRLRAKGETELANEIETVVETMRRHVDRELARLRVRGNVPSAPDTFTSVRPLVTSLIATLARTGQADRIGYAVDLADDFQLPFDRTDLAEVLGNLLENATRHAKTTIRITARETPNGPELLVEDDGPGIAAEHRATALTRGSRLDERASGTGIGLAIVQDVLEAYGWCLHLQSSALGGLKASIVRAVA